MYLNVRGPFSVLCPFAIKARSTTLIFVDSITFHQTKFLDDVHKVLAVFTGHKIRLWYLFSIPSYTERASFSFGNNENSQGARYC